MKKKLLGIGTMVLLLMSACGVEDIKTVQQQKEYYLIATEGEYKEIKQLPKGKCPITLRGKNSYASFEETSAESKRAQLKNETEKNKDYIGCVDDFTGVEIEGLLQSKEVKYLKYVGNKDPFGALN